MINKPSTVQPLSDKTLKNQIFALANQVKKQTALLKRDRSRNKSHKMYRQNNNKTIKLKFTTTK